nr:hypothetical protein Iba_chr11bCG13180 [Ipomoea batatas]
MSVSLPFVCLSQTVLCVSSIAKLWVRSSVSPTTQMVLDVTTVEASGGNHRNYLSVEYWCWFHRCVHDPDCGFGGSFSLACCLVAAGKKSKVSHSDVSGSGSFEDDDDFVTPSLAVLARLQQYNV